MYTAESDGFSFDRPWIEIRVENGRPSQTCMLGVPEGTWRSLVR
jgi:hypothetical protein